MRIEINASDLERAKNWTAKYGPDFASALRNPLALAVARSLGQADGSALANGVVVLNIDSMLYEPMKCPIEARGWLAHWYLGDLVHPATFEISEPVDDPFTVELREAVNARRQ